MGFTNFPNGVNIGSGADVSGIAYGTVVVPLGASGTALATSLDSVNVCVASPTTHVAGFAGVAVTVGAAGTVTFKGISGAGTASTAAGTAVYVAFG